MFSLRLL